MTEKIKDTRLRSLNGQAERAQASFMEDNKLLFRSDGRQLYSGHEHRERLRALERERNAVLKDVEAQAKEIGRAVASEIEGIENADPADTLTPEELEQANLRRAFALDAADTQTPEEFVKRLEAVLAAGDKGNIYAYWMAGQRKSKERNGRVPFGEVLSKMEAALSGDRRGGEVEKARQREVDAFQVESLAHHLQIGARDAAGAYAIRTYGRPMRFGSLGRRLECKLYVWVDSGETDDYPTADQGEHTSHSPKGDPDPRDELVEELRYRVRYLEEANRENRRTIAGLIQRVPELESSQEPPLAPETATEGGYNRRPHPTGGKRRRQPRQLHQSAARGGVGGSGLTSVSRLDSV